MLEGNCNIVTVKLWRSGLLLQQQQQQNKQQQTTLLTSLFYIFIIIIMSQKSRVYWLKTGEFEWSLFDETKKDCRIFLKILLFFVRTNIVTSSEYFTWKHSNIV